MFSHDVERLKARKAEAQKASRISSVAAAAQSIESAYGSQAPRPMPNSMVSDPNPNDGSNSASLIPAPIPSIPPLDDPSMLPHGARLLTEPPPPPKFNAEPVEIILPWKRLRADELQTVTEDDYAMILARDATITQAAANPLLQTNVP